MFRFIANAVLLIAVIGFTGCTSQGQAAQPVSAEAPAAKPVLLLNIISGPENPHAVVMALKLAEGALTHGREVVLFFNVAGVSIPTQTLSPDVGVEGVSVKEMLPALVERGAHVWVCPMCMKAYGVKEADLIPGAALPTFEQLFDKLKPDTAIFSY